MRTAKEFANKVKSKGIARWDIHDCSICGVWVGYVFSGEKVFYDSGCGCGSIGLQPRTMLDVAEHYNMQSNETYIAEMDEFWGFNELEETSETKFLDFIEKQQELLNSNPQTFEERVNAFEAALNLSCMAFRVNIAVYDGKFTYIDGDNPTKAAIKKEHYTM